MRKYLQVIRNNPLLKLTGQNSAGVLVKLFTGLGTSKIIAVFVGPSGMALLGNLRNLMSVLNKFVTGGLETAAIRYASEYKEKPEQLSSFVSTLFFIGACIALLLGLALFFGRSFLNDLIFPRHHFSNVFLLIALLLPLYMLNFFYLAILKGLGKFKKVIWINVLTNILNLALMALLVWHYGLKGAVITIVALPAAVLFITLAMVNRQLSLFRHFRLKNISGIYNKNLSQYALMTLISSLLFPIIYLLVRNYIIIQIGGDAAGYWEAITRVSNYYLLFVMSLLSLYVLPKMAETHSDFGFRKIVYDFYKMILPVFVIGLLGVYFLRNWLVKIIFSEEFLPMTELFLWQVIGDFFRITALVMSYQLRAKKMVWKFILSELFLAGLMYFSSVFLISKMGLEGVSMAYAMTWAVYGLVILFIFRKVFFYKWYR